VAFARLSAALADPASLEGEPWSSAATAEVVAMADFHRVSGLLAAAFQAADLSVPDELAAHRRRALTRHLRMLRTLAKAGAALDAAGIGWVIVKGPVLATRWYRDPGGRDYYDLDLLVAPDAFTAAIDALAGAGFGHANRNWSGFRSLGMGEVPLVAEDVTIDLHWHLVTFARDREVLRLPTAELLARRVPLQLASVGAATLADDDSLAHVSLHAGLAGARLLVHLCDVRAVATQVDWAAAVARLRDLGLDRVTAPVFQRTSRVLGRPNEDALTALGGGGWTRVSSLVDRGWATLAPRARNPLPAFAIAAARPTLPATLREVGANAATSLRRRVGLATVTSPGGQLDQDLDRGGPAERDRFLRDVEAGAYGS
jgi:hypothetical protein